jgi:hypothetical protein
LEYIVQQPKPRSLLAHVVAKKTSDQIIATFAFKTTVAFHTIFASIILMVSLLTLSPVKNTFLISVYSKEYNAADTKSRS